MTGKITLLAGERQAGESNKAVQACNDWLRLGPGRTLVNLAQRYRALQENTAPSLKKNTLEAWSSRYSWAERSVEYDARLEEEKNRRAREIMESGLALDYERVVELKNLAAFLKDQIFAETPVIQVITPEAQEGEAPPPQTVQIGTTNPHVWLRDVKRIGTGKEAVTVEIVRFNSAIIDEFRGVLDDLAKETGGRVSKHEMSGPNGGPIDISDEQRDRAVSALAQAIGALLPASGAGGEDSLGSAVEAAVDGLADEGV
jgi:hypothetical protein